MGNPISVYHLDEKEALSEIRDKMATLYWSLMEKYGVSNREEALNGYEDSQKFWDDFMVEHMKTCSFYDMEIETTADYRPKEIIRPEQVWDSIAKIKNIDKNNVLDVAFAKQTVHNATINDFQRRY